MHRTLKKILTLGLVSWACAGNATEILISHNDTLYTVALTGEVVDQIAIPSDSNSRTYASDLDVLDDGSVVVRGGFVEAETYRLGKDGWSEIDPPFPGPISGVLNRNFITTYENYIFIRSPNFVSGVKRLKVENGSVTETKIFTDGFSSPNGYWKPGFGQDGKFYIFQSAIHAATNTRTRFLHELNPDSMQVIRSVILPYFNTAKGVYDVDSEGNIYYSSAQSPDGQFREGITKVDRNGKLVKSVSHRGQNFDIEIKGDLVLLANNKNVYVTDTNLSPLKALLPDTFFNPEAETIYIAFNEPNSYTPAQSNNIQCFLNNPNAGWGGFGIHNSFIKNNGSSAVTGWTKTIDFGSATPYSVWSWGVNVKIDGNKIILSKPGHLQAGEKINFGLGGNYRGSTPQQLKCE